MIRTLALALCVVAAVLAACRSAPPTRSELLEKLHQCREDIPKGRPGGAISRCVKLDPSPLNGISRSELVAALGPPSFCVGLSEGTFPHGADCPPQMDPKWAFFQGTGTGPELTCETDEKQRCELVRWLRPE